jgi:hypothetical protein
VDDEPPCNPKGEKGGLAVISPRAYPRELGLKKSEEKASNPGRSAHAGDTGDGIS